METSLGGAAENFPETALSTILKDGGGAGRQEALNRLFSAYWKPVYRVIRTAYGRNIEDAKDLTQGFFDYVLEQELLDRFRRERGRFRAFLKGVLRNYLSQERRREEAVRRGGGRLVISLDVVAIERETLRLPSTATPEDIFDRQWATDILKGGVEALRSELEAEGRAAVWLAFELYELGSGTATYGDVARAVGLTESGVKDGLTLCRSRLRDLVARRVCDGVSTQEEFLQEMRDVFSRQP